LVNQKDKGPQYQTMVTKCLEQWETASCFLWIFRNGKYPSCFGWPVFLKGRCVILFV